MKSFVLTKDSHFNDIEKAFGAIVKSPDVILRLPNSLREKGVFGLEGLVCQLIATWIRGGNEKTLHTYAASPSSDEFDDLCSSLYGIVALRLADKIWTNEKELVDKKVALTVAYDRVRKVITREFKSAYKGLYVTIPSIKASGENHEYNSPFYNKEVVVGENGFRRIVDEIIDVVVPQTARDSVIDSSKGNISEIVRELFENTHKHGREDEVGDIYDINFRGVIFKSVDVTHDRLKDLVSSKTVGMVGFVSEWESWMKENARKLPVLDITVVDSGPGYARKWTGKKKNELTLEEEVKSVLQCFEKNKSRSGNSADGSGLTHVLKDLRRLRGFFRLRTGSIVVAKSYFTGAGSVELVPKDVYQVGEFVEGVSFNVVIPLVSIEGDSASV